MEDWPAGDNEDVYDLDVRLLKLIVARLGLVLLALPLASCTLPPGSPRSNILIPLTITVGVVSALYLLLWKYAGWLDRQVLLQTWVDLFLVTILLFDSGGANSFFTPFYVLIIVYASMFRGQRGGILALSVSLISYLVHCPESSRC